MGFSIFDKNAREKALKSKKKFLLTIPSFSGEINIEMTESGYEKYLERSERKYKPLDDAENLRSQLRGLTAEEEMSDFVLENDLCDYCDFRGLHTESIRSLISVVIESLYKYPVLRSKTCFIGSLEALYDRIKALANGNGQAVVQFGLENIIDNVATIKKYADDLCVLLDKMKKKKNDYLAFAFDSCGFFDSIVLDLQDFGKIGYKTLAENVKYNEKIGFHPKGCETIESLIYHEVGHLLDYRLRVSSSEDFRLLRKNYTVDDIVREVSRYAAYNSEELLAEAFSEYMCVKNPRPLSRKIGELIDKAYEKESAGS